MSKPPKFIDKIIVEILRTDFYFSNVGYERSEPSHSHGPTMRDNYLLHYVVAEKGFFESDIRLIL